MSAFLSRSRPLRRRLPMSDQPSSHDPLRELQANPPPQTGPEGNVVAPGAVAPVAGFATLSTAERLSVAGLTLIQGAVFAWATVLPWDKSGSFVAMCLLLSLVHLTTSLLFLLPQMSETWRLRVWALGSWCSAAFLLWATWAVATSGVYLSRLYGGLGQGMSAVLVAIWGLIAMLTLPLLVWGLRRTRRVWTSSRRVTGVLLLFVGGGFVSLAVPANAAATKLVGQGAGNTDDQAWLEMLSSHLAPLIQHREPRNSPSAPVSLDHRLRVACSEGALAAQQTAIAHYVDKKGKPRAACVHADDLTGLAKSLADTLQGRVNGGPVVVDRLTGVRSLSGAPSWLTALSLRPGVDGACLTNRCFTPWQLVAQSRFVTHRPLPFLADLKFGASLDELTHSLAAKRDKRARETQNLPALVAWTSQSAAIDAGGRITPLVRLHPVSRDVDEEQVTLAAAAYEAHILEAQQKNGQFRYTLNPFTRKAETRELNLARQAGTLFALCDVGSSSKEVDETARRGLQLLVDRRLEHDNGWALALSKKTRVVRLGDAALPLIALLTCRNRVGDEFDAAIAQLSRFVLHLQRSDGSFATEYDWKRQRPLSHGEALYAPGQALLGLTLLDRLLSEHPQLTHLGDPRKLSAAIQRGMNHVALEHWDVAIYPFFFVEENWNCLTARAALTRQRNDAYERFCLDYVTFKSRLIFAESSRVAPEFVGGFGFGNIIPPHNTGAAGFGEALAAALVVAKARSEPVAPYSDALHDLVGFLLRQQWTPATCAACTPLAIGSMSEHMHSPITRIDFAQHAWAAVAHGAAALGITKSSS